MIELARWNMRAELSRLWQDCFQESKRFPDYFLNNYFRPRDGLVYRVSGRIAAAVYLLPAAVVLNGRRMQAHYIFAAGTFPEFRSRGFMASLLAYAAIYGAKRGDCFSVVLPADAPLYCFYEKNGYFDFYTVRSVPVSRPRLRQMAAEPPCGRLVVSAAELNALRGSVVSRWEGSVLWSDEMFHFATGFGSAYGDRLVCSGNRGFRSYAICRMEGKQVCSVRETMSAPGGMPGLASAILKQTPAETYRFRLPADCGLFRGEGETERCGMIRPIGGTSWEKSAFSAPYLGLALD